MLKIWVFIVRAMGKPSRMSNGSGRRGFLFGGGIRDLVSIYGCLLGDLMHLSVNCVIKSKRETPPRKEKHEFLPKSSSKMNFEKFYIKNKQLFTLCSKLGILARGSPRPCSKLVPDSFLPCS